MRRLIYIDVGMADAVLGDNCIVDMPKEIYFPINKDIDVCYNNVKVYEMRNLVEDYIKLFQKILGEN